MIILTEKLKKEMNSLSMNERRRVLENIISNVLKMHNINPFEVRCFYHGTEKEFRDEFSYFIEDYCCYEKLFTSDVVDIYIFFETEDIFDISSVIKIDIGR